MYNRISDECILVQFKLEFLLIHIITPTNVLII